MTAAGIFGLAGAQLSDQERSFFRDVDPWGFILFQRNCETADQLRALTGELRECVARDAPILIDHEGGRVGTRLVAAIGDGHAGVLRELIASRRVLESTWEATDGDGCTARELAKGDISVLELDAPVDYPPIPLGGSSLRELL